jgi:type II secretory ATPase GspE/PulE/Tfp pilus assembly ATPase PilB-like protein
MAPDGLLPEAIRIELARPRALPDLLAFVLTEGRRLTDAQAGAVYLRHAKGLGLAARHGVRGDTETAAHVAMTGEMVKRESLLVVPLVAPPGEIVGVLELVNACDAERGIVPFSTWHELVIEALATNAACAIARERTQGSRPVESPEAMETTPLPMAPPDPTPIPEEEPEPEFDDVEIVEGVDLVEPVDLPELRTSADDPPVVRFVNGLIRHAIRRRASDIHLEAFETSLRVRFRIDGILRHATTRPRRLEPPIVSRIKSMANLDVSERRPQAGRLKIRYEGRKVELRVATLPTQFGESVVIRILDGSSFVRELTALGFGPQSLQQLQDAVRSPSGLVLVTGPIGSGKTTTLYGALKILNGIETKILTIEDPVESELEGVTQVDASEAQEGGVSTTLRAFLRHDPDVLMISELRDLETAQIAIRTALSGRLVLSTLHTDDAPSSVTRLLDMGIPPFLVAGALRVVVAQRLVRRLCAACREPYEVDESSLMPYGYLPTGEGPRTLYRAKGCARCDGQGLSGRVGLYQVMPFTDELRQLTLARSRPADLAKVARQEGMLTLREIGLAKAFEGLTTVDEVLRVTAE